MTAVLFVCMGNICRSPTAEGVFRKHAENAGLTVEIESAGVIDHHEGEPSDPRSVEAAARRGFDLSAIRARAVQSADFARFDRIFAMDRSNLRALRAACPAAQQHKLALFLELAAGPVLEVPDPYYGGPHGFDDVLDLVEAASKALVTELKGR